MLAMLKALYLLDETSYKAIYGRRERRDVASLVEVYAPPQTRESIAGDMSILMEADVIMSGWGMAQMTEEFLRSAPRLRAVFYASGSIRGFVTDASWQRGIVVSSARAANAVPVAEYALSQILFGLKRCWYYWRLYRNAKKQPRLSWMRGAYGGVVGIVSLGMTGRAVCEHLKRFDVRVIAYDPFAGAEEAAGLGVELCGLDEVFRRADVVSLHTPDLPETRGMITGRHFRQMRKFATFINTARGAIVREREMMEVLAERADLTAVLDVTGPEAQAPDSPLWEMENIIMTPHIAGSQGRECRRMGRYMVEELGRYVRGEPLQWAVTREMAVRMA
jgi:phosphoglycerate dehydrogenase-like enzyme